MTRLYPANSFRFKAVSLLSQTEVSCGSDGEGKLEVKFLGNLGGARSEGNTSMTKVSIISPRR